MIREIGSTLATFKGLRFHPGLNILLADRHEMSSETQTRNGSGKSSLVEIVHFLLGGSVGRESLFKASPLDAESFWGVFRFNGIEVRVERSASDPKRVFVEFEHPSRKALEFEPDAASGREYISLDDWRRWLGHVVFKLPLFPVPPFDKAFAPSFRSLFGYFARRRQDGGFSAPDKYATALGTGTSQIALSYLFSLDWQLARDFELERGKKKEHQALRKRVKAKQEDGLDTVARIRHEVAVAKDKAQKLKKDVETFQVEEHYDELAREASAAANALEKLSREAAAVTSTIEHLEASVANETGTDGRDLAKLYSAAGIQLPGSVVRTFDEVRAFHASVVANRRYHLSGEMERNRLRAANVKAEMEAQAARRSEILATLSGKGAFKDLAAMQKLLAQQEETVARLESQYKEAQSIESASSERKIERENLFARLQADFREREPILNEALLAVAEAKEALYADRSGAFEIVASTNGPEFKVNIEGDRSGGISNMEVFCFDYALYRQVTERLGGPGFLIHDSHLFDGVDERQVTTALVIGSEQADKLGGQYIVLMNSDEFEHLSFPKEFGLESKILPVRLQDTDSGGLFGIRF